MPRKLLLLDRDGTLIDDTGYPNDPAAVRLLPGAVEAVMAFAHAGYVPAVVSNQSGIARGLITPRQAQDVHEHFVAMFAAASGIVLSCYYCPHGPQAGCSCRKPRAGLLLQAARELDASPTIMIGDKPSDVEAGHAVGAYTIWLGQAYPVDAPRPDRIIRDWHALHRGLAA
jgi:D-glycero-D-manno-heptose 1,7-bisphosphate phosphatase